MEGGWWGWGLLDGEDGGLFKVVRFLEDIERRGRSDDGRGGGRWKRVDGEFWWRKEEWNWRKQLRRVSGAAVANVGINSDIIVSKMPCSDRVCLYDKD